MIKNTTLAVLILFVSIVAFGHGGHDHNFLGTVKLVHENHLVVSTMKKGEVTFILTDKTKYVRGSEPASRADLEAGARVSVYVENDGKTVVTVKIAAK